MKQSDKMGSLDQSDPAVTASDLSRILEQLEIESGQKSDLARVRRSVEEAIAVWPGDASSRWWRWVVDAGENLEMRCRPLDCAFNQIWSLAQDGIRLLFYVESTNEWIGLTGVRGRKVMVIQPSLEPSHIWMTRSQLQQTLSVAGAADIVRCCILEANPQGVSAMKEHSEHMSPLTRAWEILRPEMSDIRIVILFAVVSGILALATPLAIEALVSTVTFGRLLQPIVVLSLLLFAFLAFEAAIRALKTYVVEIIQRRLFARTAADLAYRLPRAQTEAMEDYSGRELVNRFFDIVTVQKVTAQFLLDGVTLVVYTLVGMAVLGFYHPWLLGFDVVLLALIAFVILVMGRGAIATSIKESKHKYEIAAWLQDLAGCPVAFRHNGGSQLALAQTDRLIYDYLSARRKHFRILLRQILFALGLQAVASTVLLGLGGWLVISGQLTLGQLVAAELIVTVIVGSFAKLGKHMESFYDMMASIDKLGYLFDLPVEKQDGLLSMQTERPATCLIRDVVYHHPDGRRGVDGLSLTVAAGEHVALMGRSGIGKSLLIDLLFGLRQPQHGHILVDGVDPRELRPDILRRSVALVRDIEVFEGTFADNVHLDRPGIKSSHVKTAIEQVGLLDDVLSLPEGLDTQLNSLGSPLSSNQLRKLMLARAIVGQPTLLLVDGLLDALPDHDAKCLMEQLCDPTAPWTLILITGRQSLAAQASRTIDFANLSSST